MVISKRIICSLVEDLFHNLFISLLHEIQILKSYYNLLPWSNMTHDRAQFKKKKNSYMYSHLIQLLVLSFVFLLYSWEWLGSSLALS